MSPVKTPISLASDLNLAITRNLVLKSKVLAIIFCAIMAGQLFAMAGMAFSPEDVPNAVVKLFSVSGFYLLPVGIGFFAACEAGMYFYLKKRMNSLHTAPLWLNYAVSLVETTFPTFGLYLLLDITRASGTIGSTDVLDTPPAFIYFLFIILASLQMDFKLCLAVGIASAAQFLFIKIYVAGNSPDLSARVLDLQAERSFLFIVAGIIAGLVSAKIKEAVITALKTKNELIYNLDNLVQQRTKEVVEQKNYIEDQNKQLAEKNRNISDSITYAKRIQQAMIPTEQCVRDILPGSFILYKPKDVVSGDFYFVEKSGDRIVFSVVDCTGHGVPGALMSVVGFKYLEQAVIEKEMVFPDEILNFLDSGIHHTLRHSVHLAAQGNTGSEVKDGMDLAFCTLNPATLELQFAGAFNPLLYIQNNAMKEIKGDHLQIGSVTGKYVKHIVKLNKGDIIYLSSDGYEDQFGGEKGKKFKSARFKELLFTIHQKPLSEQKEILNRTIEEWRNGGEQTDDICVMGVRI